MAFNPYYGRDGMAMNSSGDMYYRPDPGMVRAEIATYMNSTRPMGRGRISVAGQQLLKRLESGSIGPLKAETLLSAHVKAQRNALESTRKIAAELEKMEDKIDPSLAPAFLAVREEFGLPESEALVRRGLRDQAAKSFEASRKRRVDQQPPAYTDGGAGSSSILSGAPAPNGADANANGSTSTDTSRLLEQLRAAEDARRTAENERRKAMDMYLAAEGERARFEAELQSCKCRRESGRETGERRW
ncbi:uncharacterized protein LOC62_05G007575 [Vanrija pseudolonga]|uniref:Uncharacterized protein n=1 Tax=Vanrija pseudolonga TaxID=143232 RepID=A0AAF0YCR7_9TREE|nr:hypothetical protein LOC62_05G007575 [Vanrija pseudolonga]